MRGIEIERGREKAYVRVRTKKEIPIQTGRQTDRQTDRPAESGDTPYQTFSNICAPCKVSI